MRHAQKQDTERPALWGDSHGERRGRQKLGLIPGVRGSSMPILNPGSEPTPRVPRAGACTHCAGSRDPVPSWVRAQSGGECSLTSWLCVLGGSDIQREWRQLLPAQAGRSSHSVSLRHHCVLGTCTSNALFRARRQPGLRVAASNIFFAVSAFVFNLKRKLNRKEA